MPIALRKMAWKTFSHVALVLCSLATVFAHLPAAAQSFPSKTVRIVVPFAAGTGADIFARTLSVKFSETWGQPVVVENITGAGGLLGSQTVGNAAPDGHTLLLAATSWAVAPSLYAKPPYDALRDFVAIGRIGFIPSVIVVNPSLPVADLKQLIELAKSKPGQLSYSSSGKGSPSHLFVEYLKAVAKIDIVEVPYKISSQALTDVIGGQVTLNQPILSAALPQIKAGRLKALAVTTSTRSAAAPEIPTVAEAGGLPGFEAAQWQGLVAPAGTPQQVVARINADLNRILQMPDVKQRIGGLGVEFALTTPAEFSIDIKADISKWSQLIKSLAVPLD
ncbi:MAG: tripartite tricarboxylate transporter substrate binding protein [Betaproteobacteria bacterium]|nr:tripartite tricarboxylate transporter substrate binding protein [Betaproteobacteria bacterium]